MEVMFLDAHKHLLLCVYYNYQTKGALKVTNSDIKKFEKAYTKLYNEQNQGDDAFMFSKETLDKEIKQNYVYLENAKEFEPKEALQHKMMGEFKRMSLVDKKIVRTLIADKLQKMPVKEVIEVQKRKKELIPNLEPIQRKPKAKKVEEENLV